MNVVILVGRLTKDPELRTTNSGKSVCSFSVAVDRQYKQEGQPDADFFNVTAWGRQAEVICQYLNKGRQIALRGRLENRSWESQDGSKRYATDVILESFDFVGGRGDAAPASGRSPQAEGTSIPLDIEEDFSLLDEDIPF